MHFTPVDVLTVTIVPGVLVPDTVGVASVMTALSEGLLITKGILGIAISLVIDEVFPIASLLVIVA